MTDLGRVAFSTEAGVAVATVAGEVDVSNADDVLERVARAAEGRPLVLDLSDVEFLDSAAVRGLFLLARRRGEARAALVVPEDGIVRRLIEVTGLDGVYSVATSRSEALEASRATHAEQ